MAKLKVGEIVHPRCEICRKRDASVIFRTVTLSFNPADNRFHACDKCAAKYNKAAEGWNK